MPTFGPQLRIDFEFAVPLPEDRPLLDQHNDNLPPCVILVAVICPPETLLGLGTECGIFDPITLPLDVCT